MAARRWSLAVPIAAGLFVVAPFVVPSWILFILHLALAKFLVVLAVALFLRGGLVSFGHALFYAVGAYTAGFAAKWFGVREAVLLVPLGGLFGADSGRRPVAALPEGGRKLLDIALSFALQPQVLLMDEPTSGVSIEDKFQVMDTLVTVLQQSAITTMFVEHDMDVVQRYSQRVLVFNDGRVIADGPPASVLAYPEVRKAVLGQE